VTMLLRVFLKPELLVLFLGGLSLGGVLAAWLARRRQVRGISRGEAWKSAAVDVLLILTGTGVAAVTLTPGAGSGRQVDLIPLHGIIDAIRRFRVTDTPAAAAPPTWYCSYLWASCFPCAGLVFRGLPASPWPLPDSL
jgi:hypothetical protein